MSAGIFKRFAQLCGRPPVAAGAVAVTASSNPLLIKQGKNRSRGVGQPAMRGRRPKCIPCATRQKTPDACWARARFVSFNFPTSAGAVICQALIYENVDL
jgi:hypothetical protein